MFGGLGSDSFDVAGGNNGNAITVVSNDLLGHSGLLSHAISSDNLASEYNGLFVQDLVANVGDNNQPGVVLIHPTGPPRLFEEDGNALTNGVIEYKVVLTRSPDEEEDVFVTVKPVLPKRDVAAIVTTEIPGETGVPQVQRLDLANAVEGLFVLDYNGNPTDPIDVTAVDLPAAIAGALNAAAVDANVQVSLVSPNLFEITFQSVGELPEITLRPGNTHSNGAQGVAVSAMRPSPAAKRASSCCSTMKPV